MSVDYVKVCMEKEIEYRKRLEEELGDGLYEIMLDGHVALVGREGYIEWKVREWKIDRIVIENNNDKNMTNL
jgi:hypothetical protein